MVRPNAPSATATSTPPPSSTAGPPPWNATWPSPPRRRRTDTIVKEEVGADDVANAVAAWTGIPAGRLLEGKPRRLLRMEEVGQRLIGQTEAVRAVSDAVPSPGRHRGPRPPPRSSSSSAPRAWARRNWPRRLADFLFDDERAWSAST